MILTLATAPAAEPVTLAEAKTHCRVDTADDNTYLTTLITVARKHVESVTNRALVTQTWDWYFDDFPVSPLSWIEVPKPPLQSVTHVKYTDSDSVLQTWSSASYDVDTDSLQGRIYPVYNGDWPTGVRDHPKACTVRFVAGYADSGASPIDLADNVPVELKQAILLLIGHLYENRESTSQAVVIMDVPMGFDALVAPYRVFRF